MAKKAHKNIGPPKKLPAGEDVAARFGRLVYVTRMRMGFTSMSALADASRGALTHHRVKLAEQGVMPEEDVFKALCKVLKLDPADVRKRIGA